MKKIFILGLILLFFFSSTCVFANDINETSLTSDNEISVVQNANNEVILNLSENDLLETGDGTFTELQNKINNASEGSTITLENNYVYDDGFDSEGIAISKNLTIQGNGYSIDALKKSRIFKITGSNIVLTNLTIKNGFAVNGGVFVSGDSSGYVFDCSFVNNGASYRGGAIYFNTVSNGDKFFGSFVNNSARQGGAIVFNSDLNNGVFNASFYNNVANQDGGAVFVSGGCSYNIFDGYFVNNVAKESGGAFYLPFLSGSVTRTKFVGVFVNNSANGVGGAIYIPGSTYNEFSGTFIGNSADSGGAICIYTLSSSNSIGGIFINNCANDIGGAVYICGVRYGNNVFDGGVFVNNSAESGSAVYIRDDIEQTLTIMNCKFIENKANSNILDVNWDEDENKVYVSLKGNNNIINAMYYKRIDDFSFSNVTYLGANGLVNSDDFNPIFSYYSSGQNIVFEIYDNVSWQLGGRLFGITNIDGEVIFDYSNLTNNIYKYNYSIYHSDNFYYSYIGKNGTFSEGVGDFNKLQLLFSKSKDNDIIDLTRDYTYSLGKDTLTSGVVINKNNLTINGNGHIIDALGQSRIFDVDVETITFNNITLMNANNNAINFNKNLINSKLNKLTFINNTVLLLGYKLIFPLL